MKIKIVSDGTTAGTHVVNVATNEILEGVVSVNWWSNADSNTVGALIVIDRAQVHVTAKAEIL